ncbi:MAG: type II and III secretion system protein [Bacteroidales bacterium]
MIRKVSTRIIQILCISCITCLWSNFLLGQDRIEDIKNRLSILAIDEAGLSQPVDLTASKLSLQEFLRNLANLNELNLHIDPDIEGTITNNFTEVPASDILIFLCKEYELDIEISGKIITIFKYIPPKENKIVQPLNIVYDSITHLLTLDLKKDSLFKVAKEITKLTGTNIVVSPDVSEYRISSYIQNAPLNDLLEEMGYANNLKINNKGDFYLIEDKGAQEIVSNQRGNQSGKKSASSSGTFYFQAEGKNNIRIDAINTPIIEVINDVSRSLNINYFVLDDISESTTLNLSGVSYEQLLENLLNGTNYTFYKDNSIYIIGERLTENLRTTKVLQLVNRSVEKITEFIPQNMIDNVEIQEFLELNSLILSGSTLNITEIERFIKDIDKVVPIVLIEVIIINYKKGFSVSTGISAGLSEEPVQTSGSFLPLDITLGSSSINSILASFNAAGLVNLGRVTPNFYISLKALETEGILKVRSTPKLSTLNGHEANMTIGKTEYYMEETSQIFANQTTTQEKIVQFKPVNADFNLIILPIVSGDDQITLDIKVEQSDFTGTKLSKGAPPDQVNRRFESLIRIRNEEMILLGGLDDKSYESKGSGVPILSRIPIIKWLFSSRSKSKSENKLNIFIKPTVIY